MILADISAPGWVTIIVAVSLGLTPIVTAVLQYLRDKENSIKVENSTIKSDKTLGRIEQLGNSTHALVNSNMGIQLKINAVSTRKLADVTGDSKDVEAAEMAEKLSSSHDANQKQTDEHDRATLQQAKDRNEQ